MADTVYHFIDNNTGEEVYPSNDFRFLSIPTPGHIINDPDLRARYGAAAVIDRVEEQADGSVNVYIDGNEEQMTGDLPDENYRQQETN